MFEDSLLNMDWLGYRMYKEVVNKFFGIFVTGRFFLKLDF